MGLGLMWILATAVVASAAVDSAEIGLEPVYPHTNPERTRLLAPSEIEEALQTLPGWEAKHGVLFKTFTAGSFRDAVALIVRISYPLERLDHHPEIRNIYGKVYVGFTTYDQGKQITALDVETALAVEAALQGEVTGGGH